MGSDTSPRVSNRDLELLSIPVNYRSRPIRFRPISPIGILDGDPAVEDLLAGAGQVPRINPRSESERWRASVNWPCSTSD